MTLRALAKKVAKRTPDVGSLLQQWWYYNVELAPGQVSKGQYPTDAPFPTRILLRDVQLAGAECLDLGSMEGIVPALMAKGGAKRVLATDYEDHCGTKMAALKRAHDVDFDFQSVGLMYDLQDKVKGGFDLIVNSGLLYHVWSPIDVLAGTRALLKRNGLMLVATNVTSARGMRMEFNAGGRLQDEHNTFWYPTADLLDYTLRYLKLRPVDAVYLPYEGIDIGIRYEFDEPAGVLAVLCRAVDDEVSDPWMAQSQAESWEMRGAVDWARAGRQPVSSIALKVPERDLQLGDFVATGDKLPSKVAPELSPTLLLAHGT